MYIGQGDGKGLRFIIQLNTMKSGAESTSSENSSEPEFDGRCASKMFRPPRLHHTRESTFLVHD